LVSALAMLPLVALLAVVLAAPPALTALSIVIGAALFDGQVLLERDPVIMKVANSWLILNEGGPTDDKPTVTLTTPSDPNRTSAFLNVRVADIDKVYKDWSAKGAEFLTEPKDHGREIRATFATPMAI
jgi:lactoylglutathione lyase